MSVCTGAFVLAKTGLLSGKSATTFHAAFVRFATQFPDIHLKRGARFVEEWAISPALRTFLRVSISRSGGRTLLRPRRCPENCLHYGIPGARLDEPGFKSGLRQDTCLKRLEHPLCPVCGMDVDPATAPKVRV